MKKIGMIGGVSWESTAVYYRLINEAVRKMHGGLTSAQLFIHSLNYQESDACSSPIYDTTILHADLAASLLM